MTVVFLQGFSGDVTQVDNISPHVRPSGEASSRLVGGRIGAEAVKVLLKPGRGGDIRIDGGATRWEIEQRVPGREKVRRAGEIVRQGPEKSSSTDWSYGNVPPESA